MTCHTAPCLRSRPRLVLLLVAFIGMLLPMQRVQAALDWCSRDPVIAVKRQGRPELHALDVQVMVPISVVPLTEAASLTVRMPVNVRGKVIVDDSSPLLPLTTTFEHVLPPATTDRYQVELVLVVPPSGREFPVRMVVTNPRTQTVTDVEGHAGVALRTWVRLDPDPSAVPIVAIGD